MAATRALCREIRRHRIDAEITIVSRRNYHLFTPLIYQISSGLANPYHVVQPVREIACKGPVKFIQADVQDIGEKVVTDAGSIDYDYLVIALGSVANDFGVEGASEHALFLKTLQDGEIIRNRIICMFEEVSSRHLSEEEARERLTFVIAGGGATGVELAGSLADYVRILSSIYPTARADELSSIILLEAADRLLPSLDKRVAEAAESQLRRKGVKVIKGAKVARIGSDFVERSLGRINCRTIVWSAGIKANPLVEKLGKKFVIRKGKLVVDTHLRVLNSENVYAAGDMTVVDGMELPATASAAAQMGAYIGKRIAMSLIGKEIPPFAYRDRGFMISMGRFYGIALFPSGILLKGFAGWAAWRFVHLILIETVRSRLGVLFDWSMAIFYRRIIVRTDPE